MTGHLSPGIALTPNSSTKPSSLKTQTYLCWLKSIYSKSRHWHRVTECLLVLRVDTFPVQSCTPMLFPSVDELTLCGILFFFWEGSLHSPGAEIKGVCCHPWLGSYCLTPVFWLKCRKKTPKFRKCDLENNGNFSFCEVYIKSLEWDKASKSIRTRNKGLKHAQLSVDFTKNTEDTANSQAEWI